MAFPYSNSIAEITAAFPGEVFSPLDVRNEDRNGYVIVDESFSVPGAADGEGRYRMNLDQVPLEQVGLSIRVGGEVRTAVPYGEAPAAGQVAVSMETGVVEFHASDEGGAVLASYTGRGTPVMAHLVNTLSKELRATQEAVVGIVPFEAASPGPIGGTTPGAGTFTTLAATSTLTFHDLIRTTGVGGPINLFDFAVTNGQDQFRSLMPVQLPASASGGTPILQIGTGRTGVSLSGSNLALMHNGAVRLVVDAGATCHSDVRPQTSGVQNCGQTTREWANTYTQNIWSSVQSVLHGVLLEQGELFFFDGELFGDYGRIGHDGVAFVFTAASGNPGDLIAREGKFGGNLFGRRQVTAHASSVTLTSASDSGRVVRLTGASAQLNLPAASAVPGFVVTVVAEDDFDVGNFIASAGGAFLGLSTAGGSLAAPFSGAVLLTTTIISDGTNWRYLSGDRGWQESP